MTSSLVYFYFTTLTTFGYGDMAPTNFFSSTLTNVKVLVGTNLSCYCYC
ncbi:MAG: ion channel [cyanobacterium endosymbiont of Rhopalodia musculus]